MILESHKGCIIPQPLIFQSVYQSNMPCSVMLEWIMSNRGNSFVHSLKLLFGAKHKSCIQGFDAKLTHTLLETWLLSIGSRYESLSLTPQSH